MKINPTIQAAEVVNNRTELILKLRVDFFLGSYDSALELFSFSVVAGVSLVVGPSTREVGLWPLELDCVQSLVNRESFAQRPPRDSLWRVNDQTQLLECQDPRSASRSTGKADRCFIVAFPILLLLRLLSDNSLPPSSPLSALNKLTRSWSCREQSLIFKCYTFTQCFKN